MPRETDHTSFGIRNINATESSKASSIGGPISFLGKQEIENVPSNKDENINYVQAFSFGWVYKYYSGTKCKPWDNRELDALDGIRAKAFVLYTMS